MRVSTVLSVTAVTTEVQISGSVGRDVFHLLVEFQVKDEGCAERLHQEAALGQMDRLRERWGKGKVGRSETEKQEEIFIMFWNSALMKPHLYFTRSGFLFGSATDLTA